jgi:hypothetical protein
LVDGAVTDIELRDASRHAFGVGMITMLILGMAQLIAPVFAMSRAEARQPSLAERLPFPLLLSALLLRVGAGLLRDELNVDAYHHTTALAGTMAWCALLLFAVSVVQAVRREPRMRELLAVR